MLSVVAELKDKIVKTLSYLIGGGLVTALVVNLFLTPRADVVVTLVEPLPNPSDKGNIQVLILHNKGGLISKNVKILIEYPRIVQPFDYSYRAVDEALYEIREDDKLNCVYERLPPDDNIVLALNVGNDEVKPENVKIVSDEGVIRKENIKYINIEKWR